MSADTWMITLQCGHSYRLLSGTPDLATPYICGRCDNLKFVSAAIRAPAGSDTPGDSWLDDLYRASQSAAKAKFPEMKFPEMPGDQS